MSAKAMHWQDPTGWSTETADGAWYAEERRGLWWLYHKGVHVGTQISKGAAQKLAEKKAAE